MASESEAYDKLLFGVRRSVRYHFRRQRFFDLVNTCLLTASALAGFTTTVGVISQMYALGRWASIVTGVMASLQLIFTPGQLARRHNDLAREFILLERKVIASDPSKLTDLQAERLSIEAREPPHYRILNMMCHNELVKATGKDEREYVDIPKRLRLWAHFSDIGSDELEKRLRTARSSRA